MKLLIVRHGESTDDIDNQYGGWADFSLTEKGRKQLSETAEKIKGLDITFGELLCSPLARAQESAVIIGNALGIEPITFHYIKERNSYGIFSGMNKEEAIAIYPELKSADPKEGYIPGNEKSDDFARRVQEAFEKIKKMNTNIIIVTHGGFTSRFFDLFLDIKLKEVGDGGFALLDVHDDYIEVITRDGIVY